VHDKFPAQVAQADAALRIFLQKDMSFAVAPGAMLKPNTAALNDGLRK
jgi:hypothetical protein